METKKEEQKEVKKPQEGPAVDGKEPEVLTNDFKGKSIEEINKESIINSMGRNDRKNPAIQSGLLDANDSFKALLAERKAKFENRNEGRGQFNGTIQQKLQRIKAEMDEIEKELKIIEEDKGKDKMKEIEYDAKALSDVAEIQKKLSELLKSKGILKWNGASKELASSQLSKEITKNMMNSLSSVNKSGSENFADSGAYELYLNEEVHKAQDVHKFSELEKRIEKIEATIGDWGESPEFATMTKMMGYLQENINLLNPELAQKKMVGLEKLLSELKLCLEKKADDKILDFDKGEIEKLYEMSESALEYYKSLPKIIERLSTLKYLHEESAGLMNRIITIEKAQATMQAELKEIKDLMNGVKTGLATNMETVKKNLTTLDQRLAKVMGK